jgi:hypothetical protein
LKATYDSGVSAAEMTMIARGQIIKTASGSLAFQVQPNQSYEITQNDLLRPLESLAGSNSTITIKGLLYQKQKGQKKQTVPASLKVTLLEIQQKE